MQAKRADVLTWVRVAADRAGILETDTESILEACRRERYIARGMFRTITEAGGGYVCYCPLALAFGYREALDASLEDSRYERFTGDFDKLSGEALGIDLDAENGHFLEVIS